MTRLEGSYVQYIVCATVLEESPNPSRIGGVWRALNHWCFQTFFSRLPLLVSKPASLIQLVLRMTSSPLSSGERYSTYIES